MIQIANPQKCCGCTACASICARDAIKMQPDALGFLYPVVDNQKCIDCGLCEKVCSFSGSYNKSLNLDQPIAYAVRHKVMNEVETSRSGAAFIALSDWILRCGGTVYGVGYTDHFRVVHKRATTKEERDEFKGSKYVQSDLNTVFRQIKEDLINGRVVLFSGTPCQTSGLSSYVGKQLREKLFLVDIVCHGVPAPNIWRDYLDYIEKKEGKKITSVNFRDKNRFGWAAHKESFCFGNTYTYTYTYTYAFYKHITFRHSCGVCYFANLQRPSDVTIADFWGWENTDETFNADDKGCSLIFCNTEKGNDWFESVKGDLNYISAKLEDCLQPNLKSPSAIHPKRMDFERDYVKRGFVYAMKQHSLMGLNYYFHVYYIQSVSLIKKTIKYILRAIIN